jgi:hypothetical protein
MRDSLYKAVAALDGRDKHHVLDIHTKLIKIASRIQNFIRGTHRHTKIMEIA